MIARAIYLILTFAVFGIGAGIRYVFFFLVGKKKEYKDLIEPRSEDKWNVLVSLIIMLPIVYVILKCGVNLNEKYKIDSYYNIRPSSVK